VSEGTDGLFSDPPAMSRIRWIRRLLWVAVPLDLAGVLCCTSVPGAGLTLAAWALADADMARVESGHLPQEAAPELLRLKRFALGLLVLCGLSFLLQIVLLSNGTYERWFLVLDLWWSAR